VKEKLRGSKVSCRAEIAVTRTDSMTCGQLGFGLGKYSFADSIPLVVPTVKVSGGDAVDSRHDFAELAGTVAAGPEGSLGFVPKLNVIGEKRILSMLKHLNPLDGAIVKFYRCGPSGGAFYCVHASLLGWFRSRSYLFAGSKEAIPNGTWQPPSLERVP
jgi:hypothetical protein